MKKIAIYLALAIFLITTAFIGETSQNVAEDELLQKKDLTKEDTKASLTGGLLILVSLGLGYGFRKIYEIRNHNIEEVES
ncbi:MAG: hypothetical protein JW731_03520 [Bacteroidales bacterium]|nr:hypothetical protein [Bacteroidales bacterium]